MAGGALAVGSSRQRQVTFKLPDGVRSVGLLTFSVTVDTDNAVEERSPDGSAEQNNSASIKVTSALATYADLVVDYSYADPDAGWQAGDPLTVYW